MLVILIMMMLNLIIWKFFIEVMGYVIVFIERSDVDYVLEELVEGVV